MKGERGRGGNGIPDWIYKAVGYLGHGRENDGKGNKSWRTGGRGIHCCLAALCWMVFRFDGGDLSRGGLVMGDLAVADADIVCLLPWVCL